MASIVISVLRDGDAPDASSLGLTRLGREIADRLGATVYAACAVADADDLDVWVAALGRAGADRVACARYSADSEPGNNSAIASILSPMIGRLNPILVLVQSDPPGSEIAAALAAQLSFALDVDAELSWHDDQLTIDEIAIDGQPRVLTSSAAPPTADGLADVGGEDIDVLFFRVDEDGESSAHSGAPVASTPS